MKFTLVFALLLVSSPILADADQAAQIKALEARIRALEARSGTSVNRKGLKVLDLKGKHIESLPSTRQPAASAAQMKEVMEKLERYKKSREEGMKLLEELEKEGL